MSFLGLLPSAVLFCFTISFFLRFPCAAAKLFNITFDDSGKDPATGALIQYLPNSTLWHAADDCHGCNAHPDPTLAFDGTWHDSTFDPSVGNTVTAAYIPFTGTAIYVFCIIAHTSSSPDGNTDLQFFIDSEVVGQFQLQPTGSTGYDYNISVYVNESLPNGLHNLTIQNGRIGGLKTLLLLDKIVYSQDDGETVSSTVAFTSPASTSTFPAGTSKTPNSMSYAPIIGGVVGGLAFILALGGLFLFLRRRRRQQHSRNTVNLLASESTHPSADSSTQLMSQAPLSRPYLDTPFRVDPILPDTYTSSLGPSALPRPSTFTDAAISSTYPSTIQSSSRHGRGHSAADPTTWSPTILSFRPSTSDARVPSARTVAVTLTDSSLISPTSTSASTASLPSRSRRRPPGVSTRKRPHPRNENTAATEDVEAPPAYEDIDTGDDSARVEQAPLTGRAI